MSKGIEIIGLPPAEAIQGDVSSITNLVVAYIRVSSKQEDRQTLSPETQVQICRDYCHRNGLSAPIIMSERGSAATVRNRPIMLKMLEMCRSGQVEHIVVQDLTRLFREAREALNTFDEMERLYGVKFHSALMPNLDTTTADGEFTRGLQVLLGHRERRLIAERTSRALQANRKVTAEMAASSPPLASRFERGKLFQGGGIPPFGYKWGGGQKGKRRFVRDEHDYRIVLRIKELRDQGLGYQRISRMLANEYLRDRNGKLVGYARIDRVLRRGYY